MAQGIKETLKKLVALQEVDVELYEYKRELNEKPAQSLLLKAEYDKKKVRLEDLEKQIKEIDRARKAKELDLKEKENGISNANTQMMTLKTNKEYQAKLFEIENFKADKSVLEDEVLKLMDASEKLLAALTKEKVFLLEEEKKYMAEKEAVDAVLVVVREKIAAIEVRRQAALQGIDSVSLALYERVLLNREGVALVPLEGGACGGCFMHLPQQTVNQIKMFDQIVRCDLCARLLFTKEDLE